MFYYLDWKSREIITPILLRSCRAFGKRKKCRFFPGWPVKTSQPGNMGGQNRGFFSAFSFTILATHISWLACLDRPNEPPGGGKKTGKVAGTRKSTGNLLLSFFLVILVLMEGPSSFECCMVERAFRLYFSKPGNFAFFAERNRNPATKGRVKEIKNGKTAIMCLLTRRGMVAFSQASIFSDLAVVVVRLLGFRTCHTDVGCV